MTSTKRLTRQERRANYDYFRDLLKKKGYDDASVVILEHPEIINCLSKKELRVVLNSYALSMLNNPMNTADSALEKAVRYIEAQLNGVKL